MSAMNPAQIRASRLVGTWHSVLVAQPEQTGFFRITNDFRFFAVFPSFTVRADRMLQNRLWIEQASDFSFKLFRSDRPFEIHHRYFFQGEVLMLARYVDDQKHHEWRCTRVSSAELPDYFEPEFAKAMEMPW